MSQKIGGGNYDQLYVSQLQVLFYRLPRQLLILGYVAATRYSTGNKTKRQDPGRWKVENGCREIWHRNQKANKNHVGYTKCSVLSLLFLPNPSLSPPGLSESPPISSWDLCNAGLSVQQIHPGLTSFSMYNGDGRNTRDNFCAQRAFNVHNEKKT